MLHFKTLWRTIWVMALCWPALVFAVDGPINVIYAKDKPLWLLIYNANYTELLYTGGLIVTTLIIAWLLWLLPSLKLIKISLHDHDWQSRALKIYKFTILLAAVCITILAIVGYGRFVVFLCQRILVTAGLVLVYAWILRLGNNFLGQEKIHYGLNIGYKKKFIEFTLLKISLYVLLAVWFTLLLLEWWGVPLVALNSVKSFILDGRSIYSIRIIPMQLIIALIVFSLIQMSWKYTLLYLAKVHKFDPEADSQVIITSLLSYVVLAIAVLCALSVSGVDFTGLAIIAGALAIGIGLGLQNIVNNFVSGIILLIEQPIRPGDRVLIQGKEGFVKKISFRYTRILTLAREDVIIPNSDVMSNPIVNFMFSDKLSKFKCTVGVAYDSDLDLVKQTLLHVAAQHADVLQDTMNKPMVYMKEFGESNLCFELECVVPDINIRYRVLSDLNFMIVKAFKANNIIMAYPQREVHIKNPKVVD
jgi:Small-conductance mechanosensitive channel